MGFGKHLWYCSLKHVLDSDGFHVVSSQERLHGRVTVPLDEPENEPESLPAAPPIQVNHRVDVVHTHKPRPRPNTMAIRVRNWEGREYRTSPVNIYGQAVTPVHIPVVWLTGNDQDLKLPDVQLMAEFWYPEGL